MPSERVAHWLAESVGVCPWCENPVARTDRRGLDYEERISHLRCLEEGEDGPCPVCARPITRREKREESPQGLLHKGCAESSRRR